MAARVAKGKSSGFCLFFFSPLDGFNAFRVSWFGGHFLFTWSHVVPLPAGCVLLVGLCVLGGALAHAARACEHGV